MGIWPKYADGTDINAVDVSGELGIVATADDSGYLNIMNFPCVVQEAPRRVYGGHSSFVQNVKFLPCAMNSKSEQRSVCLYELQYHTRTKILSHLRLNSKSIIFNFTNAG